MCDASQTVQTRNRMIKEADIIVCSDSDWAKLSEKNPGAKFVLLQSHVTASLAGCGPLRIVTKCVSKSHHDPRRSPDH